MKQTSSSSILLALAVLLVLSAPPPASAQNQPPVFLVHGVSSTTDAPLVELAATGELLVGLRVTVVFEDGSQESAAWAATGPQAGGVLADSWSLTQLGDTIVGSWLLQNDNPQLGIAACILDGAGGTAVFDTTFGGEFGTSASGAGLTITESTASTSTSAVEAVYRDVTGIQGAHGVGDLFRFLEIYFTSTGGLLPGEQFAFHADVDLLELLARILPTGDIDLNGSTDLDDYAQLGTCLAGPDTQEEPLTCTPELFDRTDLDRDLDTDLGDFAAWTLALSR